MNKVIFTSIFSLIIVSSIGYAFAQNIEFKNSNFKSDKEGLKLAKENIKFADNFRDNAIIEMLAMHDAEILYSQAVFYYQKAQSFNPNNAELNYKIGSCMLFTHNKENAFSYLKKATSLSNDFPNDFLFYKGMCLQLDGEFGKAIEQFELFRNSAKKKELEEIQKIHSRFKYLKKMP